MRTTKTLSITLPPEMLARAAEIARREHRTMSELVREALRDYERKNWWSEMVQQRHGNALHRRFQEVAHTYQTAQHDHRP